LICFFFSGELVEPIAWPICTKFGTNMSLQAASSLEFFSKFWKKSKTRSRRAKSIKIGQIFLPAVTFLLAVTKRLKLKKNFNGTVTPFRKWLWPLRNVWFSQSWHFMEQVVFRIGQKARGLFGCGYYKDACFAWHSERWFMTRTSKCIHFRLSHDKVLHCDTKFVVFQKNILSRKKVFSKNKISSFQKSYIVTVKKAFTKKLVVLHKKILCHDKTHFQKKWCIGWTGTKTKAKMVIYFCFSCYS